MVIEYTGRQFEVTPAVREQIEHGLAKLSKILGPNFKTNVILTSEKYRYIAEISVAVRNHAIVAIAENGDMTTAVGVALDRIERQALKYKGRWRAKKRNPKAKAKLGRAEPDAKAAAAAAGVDEVPVVVHTFPARSVLAAAGARDEHVVRSRDSVARQPMTLEEAVKEAEFRDRDVFVFRDGRGRVMVLHRTRDGKIELIEA
jgi:putative sigma-54 modulation protein